MHRMQQAQPIMPMQQLVHVFRSNFLPSLGYSFMPAGETNSCVCLTVCIQQLRIAQQNTEIDNSHGGVGKVKHARWVSMRFISVLQGPDTGRQEP